MAEPVADEIPAFDPTKPYEVVNEAPPFDPTQPFEVVEEGNPFAEFAPRKQDEANPFAQYAPDKTAQPTGLLPGRYYDPLELQIAKVSPYVANIMAAFGEGATASLHDRLGLSDESRKYLQEQSILPATADDTNVFRRFNDSLITPLAVMIDAAHRYPGAIYSGFQAAGIEAGLHRDIVSMPDAFAGSLHPFGIPEAPGAAPHGEPVPHEVPPHEAAPEAAAAPAPAVEAPSPPTVPSPPEIADAKGLGIIGPPPPRMSDLSPTDAATRSTADPVLPPDAAETVATDPWWQRFEHFVGKLDAPDDVKDLISQAARENGSFLPARQGDIPLRQIADIAEAAGVDASEINVRGLGRNLRNDAEVRVAMRMMLQVTDEVKAAAREVQMDGSPDTLIKLQEAIMRRDLAVEQVVGLRAEWGRTGNVFQEFMRNVKDQETLSEFLKTKGRTPEDLKTIANAIEGLDRSGAAKLLNDARTPDFFDKLHWYWQNALISGWLTHTKYAAANTSYLLWERGLVTPLAAMIGKAREVAGIGDTERMFAGEAVSGLSASIQTTPTAFMAALKSVRYGLKVPLPGETAIRDAMIARGEAVPPQLERNFLTEAKRPIGGILGRAIGIPGDAANAIHTFFRIIGYHGEMQALAYRQAAAEGHSPFSDAFRQRTVDILSNPTQEMMQASIDQANRGTFIDELGERGQAFNRLVKAIPVLRWIFPFRHIPLNLMKRTIEQTPAAVLSREVRADLAGENGGIAQDKAIARIAAGSLVGAWFVHQALNGRMTGDLPADQKERDVWKLVGKQPNSILIGDHWVSFNKFGPIGDIASLSANLAQVIPHLESGDDDDMTKATYALASAFGKVVTDEVGMQSLNNIFEALRDPDRSGPRFVASTAGSFLPYSSFLQQTASFNDPYMREAQTFIDAMKYRIPGERETLLPKRDWTGAPVDNPQYGSILRQTRVNVNAVDMEAALLGIRAAPPTDRVGGVKLPPHMYDEYQEAAGLLTRQALQQIVTAQNYYNLPVWVREEVFRKTMMAARQQAAAMMMMRHPEIIKQSIENIRNRIEGNKATKLQDITLH